MTDTAPDALRRQADALAQIINKSAAEVAAMITLRALAAEKEAAQSWRRTAERCHEETLTVTATLATAARDARRAALEEAAKAELTEEAREWIEQRASDLFRESERRRGSVRGQVIRAEDFLDYWTITATHEWFDAAIRALIDREPAPVVGEK